MERHQISNFQALRDCIELTQQYDLAACLEAAKKLCDSLNEDDFAKVLESKKYDHCFHEVYMLAVAKWGARNVYSALLYLSGDTDGHQLQLAAYKYASERATKELNDLLGLEE